MRRILGVLVATLVSITGMLIGPASPACACSCVPGSEQEHTERADVVFVGDALAEADVPAELDQVRTRFRVRGVSKGTVAGVVEVTSYKHGATCGVRFAVGNRYKVYAGSEPGEFTTNLCAGNQDLGRSPSLAPVTPVALPRDDRPATSWLVAGGGAVLIVLAGAALWLVRRHSRAGGAPVG